jgi:hypothetical protein
MMNGFPAVNHGVAKCRQVIESVKLPMQVRHGTPDARLLTAIAYAGGFTSYEGGGLSYNLPYCKNIPMERTIRDWQYVDRLTGLYEEMGISINREPYGPLTGTLVPPCVSHAVAIIVHVAVSHRSTLINTLAIDQGANRALLARVSVLLVHCAFGHSGGIHALSAIGAVLLLTALLACAINIDFVASLAHLAPGRGMVRQDTVINRNACCVAIAVSVAGTSLAGPSIDNTIARLAWRWKRLAF